MSHQYNFNQLQAIARASGAYLLEGVETENVFANDLATFNDEGLGGKYGTEGYRLVRDRIDTEIRLAKEEEEENADRQLENIGLMEDIRKDQERALKQITVGNITMSGAEWDKAYENLQDDDFIEKERLRLQKQGKSDEQIDEILNDAVVVVKGAQENATESERDASIAAQNGPNAQPVREVIERASSFERRNSLGYTNSANMTERSLSFSGANISEPNETTLRENFADAAKGENQSYSNIDLQQTVTIDSKLDTLGLG
ncbi:MAG: hypothetical protein CL565_02230 [Alphaproteobacteria bacterium]|nr:hypothetical protein [Alphaproteobacteria bacterium]|tara:strand:+ start:164 stop:940 length:777 start_codon:yes stop_codon:yes gene_type:complete